MKVADYLVRALAACGVRHIFGYPGSPLVPLLAALQRQDMVEWVLMRHENAAALAAAAQAKLTGQLAVCVAPPALERSPIPCRVRRLARPGDPIDILNCDHAPRTDSPNGR